MSARAGYKPLTQGEPSLELRDNGGDDFNPFTNDARVVYDTSRVSRTRQCFGYPAFKVATITVLITTVLLLVLGTKNARCPPPSFAVCSCHVLRGANVKEQSHFQPRRDASLRPRFLRLLMPASEVDANLCKSVLSGSVLGYPAQELINHKKEFHNTSLIAGGAHLAKIHGVLNNLEALDSRYDDDIVIIVDAYDVWFQLPPSVLLQRYYEINRKANSRIKSELGDHAVSQRVIFSAQKRCFPLPATHPACWAIPQSSLAPKVYGEMTDVGLGDEKNPFKTYRQRYLSSGSCVGTVAAVRALFQRAREKADVNPSSGSDQQVFNEIFGEQEFYRHVSKMQNRGMVRRVVDWLSKQLGMAYSYQLVDTDTAGDRQMLAFDSEGDFEFGIGLDYESQIQQATVFAEYDTRWLSRNERPKIRQISTEMGLDVPMVSSALPDDVRSSLPPFYSDRGGKYPHGPIPVQKTWETVPLFTNMWTGISPVMVHHNAHRDNLKERIRTDWTKTWYQPHMRALLNRRALLAQTALATTYDEKGREQTWWGQMFDHWQNDWAGVHSDNDTDNLLPLAHLCDGEGVWDEIMGDGKGPWKDPRYRES